MDEVKFGPVGRLAFLEWCANPFRRSDKLPSGAPDLDFGARLTLSGGLQKNPRAGFCTARPGEGWFLKYSMDCAL